MFRLIPVWGAANKVAVNTREQVSAHVTFSLSVSSGHLEMFGGLLSLDLSDGAHCFRFRSRLQSQAAGTLLETLTSFCGVCSPWALVFKLPPFLWISTEIRNPCCFLDVIDSSLNPQLSYAIEHFILFLRFISRRECKPLAQCVMKHTMLVNPFLFVLRSGSLYATLAVLEHTLQNELAFSSKSPSASVSRVLG